MMTPRDMNKTKLVNRGIEISRVPSVTLGFIHLSVSESRG